MMKYSMRSTFGPQRNCAETESEVSLKAEQIWRCFSKLVSYGCNIPESKVVFYVHMEQADATLREVHNQISGYDTGQEEVKSLIVAQY